MTLSLKAGKVPGEELSLLNFVVINERDLSSNACKHVLMETNGIRLVFSVLNDQRQPAGQIGLNLLQRKAFSLSLGQELRLSAHQFNNKTETVASFSVEIDYLSKKDVSKDPVNSDKLAERILREFGGTALTKGQQLATKIPDTERKLIMTVTDLQCTDFSSGEPVPMPRPNGIITGNTVVTIEKVESASIVLTGKSKGKTAHRSIVNPEWDFSKLGIGGLDDEFKAIFRRAFASRVFPPEIIEELGMKHVRGILLYGPPGTGKTTMARQIGAMLNAREPKIVNGPQILDKYVGESEANIRKLFADAEEEQARLGGHSALHTIIFDEIDAICKSRGTQSGSSGVGDTVVNQLLSKIDGVDQLNNILVIGMTNRRDLIDEALMRPGRLEVQMEIGLPDEFGRHQILVIHTKKMMEFKKVAPDVDLRELAKVTKNFSGAELEGLVRAATTTAMNRLVKPTGQVQLDEGAIEQLQVNMNDFRYSLEHDVKPLFGTSDDLYEQLAPNGVLVWSEKVQDVLDLGRMMVEQVAKSERTPLVSVLMSGAANTGKTALAGKIAIDSNFPFLKVISPQQMIGYHESAKCHAIKKIFDDAYKSAFSCIILDDIETLLDYVAIGPRFSNIVLQALKVLLKNPPPKGRRLFLICTTSSQRVLREMGLTDCFSTTVHVPAISETGELISALKELGNFTTQELTLIQKEMSRWPNENRRLWVGIKKLITLVEMACHDTNKVQRFIQVLEEECEYGSIT